MMDFLQAVQPAPVLLWLFGGGQKTTHVQERLFVKMAQHLVFRCVFAIGSQHLGCWSVPNQNTSRIQNKEVV